MTTADTAYLRLPVISPELIGILAGLLASFHKSHESLVLETSFRRENSDLHLLQRKTNC